MPRLDNEELIGLLWRASQGSQTDFATLYERIAPLLYALCLRLLHRREWAEEVLQEVYLRIWH